MESLTTLDELRRHIAVLACVEETEAPFESCYLNLAQGEEGYRGALRDRALAVRSTLEHEARADFDIAIRQVEVYLSQQALHGAKGAALFSRHFRAAAGLGRGLPVAQPLSPHGAEGHLPPLCSPAGRAGLDTNS